MQETSADYYEVLQLSPNADFETIERVFRLLAKRYHPDNGETGNEEKFRVLLEAYRVLSDAELRAAYDAGNEGLRADKWKGFYQPSLKSNGSESDSMLRHGILSILYTARRQNTSNPGVGVITLENLLGCPQQVMEFHLWYLKEKCFIKRTDSGEYAITVEGVDALGAGEHASEQDRLIAPCSPQYA